ncbi:PTS sugar transporter subunit IIA [Halalkalibacter nanhaiisediminis]|uniref:PTS system IIA component (Glc family) n=1 Tax=Halalkalibacter nanhaiisediminis TaxID=688079 RepID=A0A562QMH1_9BACI|nr:PTS glucose transporter subunit IIA [Halalkalibacter nanhaiisediminis]TWI57958.1 PTS system IIA component (Glc family) [Halalkalibacter nanhaiisediminis]
MFKKLFGLDKKKEATPVQPQQEMVHAPLTGKLIAIEDVPDPTFSQKMMGDGFAIEPSEGKVVAPVSGEIMQVFPTKHAIGIKTPGGAEVLLHIGLETVNMKGEGFTAHVKEGDKVKLGDALVDFDLDLVKEKAASTITPVVITNMDDLDSVVKEPATETVAGETPLLTIKSKG